jgi:hypothetical protein
MQQSDSTVLSFAVVLLGWHVDVEPAWSVAEISRSLAAVPLVLLTRAGMLADHSERTGACTNGGAVSMERCT